MLNYITRKLWLVAALLDNTGREQFIPSLLISDLFLSPSKFPHKQRSVSDSSFYPISLFAYSQPTVIVSWYMESFR